MTKVIDPKKKKTIIILIAIVAFYLLLFLLEKIVPSNSMLFPVLKKTAVYALVAASMNLLNGFTGLFSLGQAGFMLLGAYAYSIFMIPEASRESVYRMFGGEHWVTFSISDVFGTSGAGGAVGMILALILAGCVAAVFGALIGLPVLRLKSDYLAIATLGFAEIIRAIFQWDKLGPLTNGANMLNGFPYFSSTVAFWLVAGVCIAIIVLLINSSYGRAFKSIRDDEVAAEAMGIKLSRHKQMSFVTSCFFAGIGGALLAMFACTAQANNFKTNMTYEILLIVVLGGIGSISGSVLASFLFTACNEWWLRFLDRETFFADTFSAGRIAFVVVFILVIAGGAALLWRRESKRGNKRWKKIVLLIVAAALTAWLIFYLLSGSVAVPLLRGGFRKVVFSVIIMCVVLFFRQGIMGDKELPEVLQKVLGRIRGALRRDKAPKKGGAAQ